MQQIWTGTRWFIEGDIAQFFDTIHTEQLVEILGRNIHDNRFLQLVRQLLKAGYWEEGNYHPTLSGVPQGGVLSPLLSNVFLHEFDQYMTKTLIPAYTRGEKRRTNPPYQNLCYQLWKFKGQKGHGPQVRALHKAQRQLPSKDQYDPEYRRLWYVRYADDFLCGYIGSRQEAEEIKLYIKTWLHENLNLELSADKTLITHATDGAARFLGYEITNQQCNTKCTNRIRSANGRIALRVPRDVIAKKCQPYRRKGKPIHRPEREFDSDYSILTKYQQEYRGVVEYYLLATNVCHLDRLRWVMEVSLLKTLAAKHKSSVSKMAAKYKTQTIVQGKPRKCFAVEVARKGKPPLVAHFGGIPLQRQRETILDDNPWLPQPNYTELEQRVRANSCEVCGSDHKVEVHHIRKLADLKSKSESQYQHGSSTGSHGNARRWYYVAVAIENCTTECSMTTVEGDARKLCAGKLACTVGGRAVGKGPQGTSLAAYSTTGAPTLTYSVSGCCWRPDDMNRLGWPFAPKERESHGHMSKSTPPQL